jgi:hypothetical protein
VLVLVENLSVISVHVGLLPGAPIGLDVLRDALQLLFLAVDLRFLMVTEGLLLFWGVIYVH